MSEFSLKDLEDSDWIFSGPNPLDFLDNSDLPEWVERIFERLATTVLPTVNILELKDGVEATARNTGAALGGMHSLFNELESILETPDSERNESQSIMLKAFEIMVAGETSEDHYALHQNIAIGRSFVSACMSEMVENRSQESVDFLSGFTIEAQRTKIDSTTMRLAEETEASSIYTLLIVFGLVAQERLNSLREFYDFLEDTQNNVCLGSFERFRKVCNRIGFSIGEPGRKPKRDIEEIKLTLLEGIREAQNRLDEKKRSSNRTSA